MSAEASAPRFFRPRGGASEGCSTVYIGKIAEPIRKGTGRGGRPFLSFTFTDHGTGRSARVMVRGAAARRFGPLLFPGAEIRLDATPRVAVLLRVSRIGPAREVWRARLTSGVDRA